MTEKKRHGIEALALLLQNANFKGFFTGKIYEGAAKNVCVPGLNCYSCPGAVGACPIGSLQGFLSGMKIRVPYYVIGLLLFFGAALGRAVCGFVCPFGFLQEMLNRIPSKKIGRFRADRALRFLKYAVLLVCVLLLPALIKLTPVFCKYICPSGAAAGLLLTAADSAVRGSVGLRFLWKAALLLSVAVLSVFLFRPFCKYVCPLGAIYAPLNRIALLRYRVDADRCVSCGLCETVCKMGINPAQSPNDPECIRCGRCVDVCPEKAITSSFRRKNDHAQ